MTHRAAGAREPGAGGRGGAAAPGSVEQDVTRGSRVGRDPGATLRGTGVRGQGCGGCRAGSRAAGGQARLPLGQCWGRGRHPPHGRGRTQRAPGRPVAAELQASLRPGPGVGEAGVAGPGDGLLRPGGPALAGAVQGARAGLRGAPGDPSGLLLQRPGLLPAQQGAASRSQDPGPRLALAPVPPSRGPWRPDRVRAGPSPRTRALEHRAADGMWVTWRRGVGPGSPPTPGTAGLWAWARPAAERACPLLAPREATWGLPRQLGGAGS